MIHEVGFWGGGRSVYSLYFRLVILYLNSYPWGQKRKKVDLKWATSTLLFVLSTSTSITASRGNVEFDLEYVPWAKLPK